MSGLIELIPVEVRTAIVPELIHVIAKLKSGLEKDKVILSYLSSDEEMFVKVFGVLMQNGLTVANLRNVSMKSTTWDARVGHFFDQMQFDSIIGIENRFPNNESGHSITFCIPMNQCDLERLTSMKNDLEQNEFDPVVSKSMLLRVLKNYGEDYTEPSTTFLAHAKFVMDECSPVLEKVRRVAIVHFFNEKGFDRNGARKELREEDEKRQDGLDMDDLVSLDPIYVDKFVRGNNASVYVDLFKRLVNLKSVSVDMLTAPLVDALEQTGRLSSVEHGLLNTHDLRETPDASAVEKFVNGSRQNLKLLHANCCSAVVRCLEAASFAKLMELDVVQDREDCTRLLRCLTTGTPGLTKLTLCPRTVSFMDFLARLKQFAVARPMLECVILDIRRVDLPKWRQVHFARGRDEGELEKIQTLGLIFHCGHPAELEFVKLFVGVSELRIVNVMDGKREAKRAVERNMLDESKPRKLIWNMIPTLKKVKLLNGMLRLVESWDR